MNENPKRLKPGPKEIYSTESMIQAVIESEGYIRTAAVKLGCKPQIIHMRALYEKDLKKTIDDSRAIRRDTLADENMELLSEAYKGAKILNQLPNPTMTIFTLKALGGWKESGSEKEAEMNPSLRAAMSKEKADG